MQQTQDYITILITPWRQRQASDDAWLDSFGTVVEAPDWLIDESSIKDWAKALPKALREQASKVNGTQAWAVLVSAYELLQARGFTGHEIDLARLDDDGLLTLAAAQAATARVADGLPQYEPPGRPEHDRSFNMRRLRAKRAEVIINLESAIKVTGMNPEQTPYAGDESRRLRNESRERLAEWMEGAYIVIPERDTNGNITGENRIPLIEAGSTRYKSYAEFVGFVSALQELAQEEGRDWCMVTTTPPAHMHPSSPSYDGTTPRQANRWLSKKNKAALDLLRKWLVECAGVRMKEPHQSGVPHAHAAIAHTARAVAEYRLEQLLNTVFDEPEKKAKNGKIIPAYHFQLTLADLTGESRVFDPIPKEQRAEGWHKDDPENWRIIPAMSRDALIDGMACEIIEAAFERQFLDLVRDDHTGRLIYGVGVDFKFDDKSSGASFISYVMPYILKSFSIDHDKLPKRENYGSDEEHKQAMKETVRQQVEHGGEIGGSAWAAAHRIRVREIFGMPSRSPWRALGKQHFPIADRDMENMRQLIRNNQHAEYVRKQGGLNPGRNAAVLRMRRETLDSIYPLRPDMLRRRVLGVVRYEPEVDGTMQPVAFHRTYIPGCKIVAQHGAQRDTQKAIEKEKEKATAMLADNEELGVLQEHPLNGAGALAPNYPRRGQSPLDSGGTVPPPEQKLLH